MKKLITVAILLCTISSAFAAGEAAVMFLLVSPSPQANGMGQIYSGNAVNSSLASMMNPALTGLQARTTWASHENFTQTMNWRTQFPPKITFDAEATSFGVNLKEFTKYPVSIGVAWHKTRFDMGEYNVTTEDSPDIIGKIRSYEEVTGTTVSLAVDYYVRASFGMTFKSIDSNLSAVVEGPEILPNAVASIDAHDIGFILQVPVVDLLVKADKLNEFNGNLSPFVDPGFYYSKTNIGDKIKYIDAAQADPLPRNLSIGYNLNAGLTYQGKYRNFTLLSAQWAREVNDILIDLKYPMERSYASGLHDIDLWDNLVRIKGNDGIWAKRGYELNLGDFIYARQGQYEDFDGFQFLKTRGWSINYTQPLKILAAFYPIENNILGKLLTHLRFEKHVSQYSSTSLSNTLLNNREFKSYTIRLENIALH